MEINSKNATGRKQAVTIVIIAIFALALSLVFSLKGRGATIVFFGDSITYMGDWQTGIPNKNVYNLGVSGNCVHDLLERTGEVKALNPDKVFVMAGINDLMELRSPTELLADWRTLIEELDGYSVYVQGLLPVAPKYGVAADAIIAINNDLQKLCGEYGAVYIDLYPLFADADGTLIDQYTIDGLHLSEAAYEKWIEAIKGYVD